MTKKREIDGKDADRGRHIRGGHRQDVCDFRDGQSKGGSRNMPMQLGAFFVMKDGKVVSHELDTAPPRMQ